MAGGLATNGYIAIYLPLCDGNGRRLIGGIAEEFLWLCIQDSYHNLAERWHSRPARAAGEGARYRTHFNAPSFALHLDRALQEAGVDILFDTLFSDVVTEDGRITHVIVDNRDGRTAYASPVVIDATGDALVAHRAGRAYGRGQELPVLLGLLYGRKIHRPGGGGQGRIQGCENVPVGRLRRIIAA